MKSRENEYTLQGTCIYRGEVTSPIQKVPSCDSSGVKRI